MTERHTGTEYVDAAYEILTEHRVLTGPLTLEDQERFRRLAQRVYARLSFLQGDDVDVAVADERERLRHLAFRPYEADGHIGQCMVCGEDGTTLEDVDVFFDGTPAP
jgi:hypothetical protein